jgi:hypothetical protein
VSPIVEQYAPQDIFNMDETALFYNVQPKRTLDIKAKGAMEERHIKTE